MLVLGLKMADVAADPAPAGLEELLAAEQTVEGVQSLFSSGQVDLCSANGVEALVSCCARGHLACCRALCGMLEAPNGRPTAKPSTDTPAPQHR